MRILIAAAVLAAFSLAATAPAAASDSPASVPMLAPGEVLLEVNGLGMDRSPATLATVTATANGRGPTAAEARRALDAEVQRMTAAARAAGAGAADIRVVPGASGDDMEVYGGIPTTDSGEGPSPEAQARRFYARSTVLVRLREPSRAAALQSEIGGSEFYMNSSPVYELTDDSAARRTARTRAIAAARADAESYAAALGMRIVRVLRVTERTGLDFLGMAVSESNRLMQSWRSFSSAQAEGQVETYVLTGVDFVMAPR